MSQACNCKRDAQEKWLKSLEAGEPEKVKFPFLCPTVKGRVHIRCQKCHEILALDFGNLTYERAVKALQKFDSPGECPGFHVELGGWHYYWQFDEALKLIYPKEAPCALKVRTPVGAGAKVDPPPPYPLSSHHCINKRKQEGVMKTFEERPKVIFICAICGTATRRVPLCGASDRGWVWLCRACGPINWEVMQLCREAVVRARLN